MARIAIYIGRHLCTAPRPVKEADALAAAGHEVTVCGLWSDEEFVRRDQRLLRGRAWTFEPYADCRPATGGGRRRWWWIRARNRLARALYRGTRRGTPDLFGYGASRLLADASRRQADLLVFHSEGGLYAAERLHRAGRRVGVDFEDWFSRDLPEAQRTDRPIAELAGLEAKALHYPYVLATSHAMAGALADAYGGPKPAVIYNTFPAAEAPHPKRADDRVSLHWFSQTLGPGRGLELLFAALPQIAGEWETVIRADDGAGAADHFLAQLPHSLRARVHFCPTVPTAELPRRIADHDIGLALDVSTIPSRNLTITNKLFQYLQAGLAVVASDTAGHREALERAPDAGQLFASGSVASLVSALQALVADRPRLARARQAAYHAGQTLFDHERQVPIYVELAAKALGSH